MSVNDILIRVKIRTDLNNLREWLINFRQNGFYHKDEESDPIPVFQYIAETPGSFQKGSDFLFLAKSKLAGKKITWDDIGVNSGDDSNLLGKGMYWIGTISLEPISDDYIVFEYRKRKNRDQSIIDLFWEKLRINFFPTQTDMPMKNNETVDSNITSLSIEQEDLGKLYATGSQKIQNRYTENLEPDMNSSFDPTSMSEEENINLISNLKFMRQFYKDYSPVTALKIFKAIPTAWKNYNHDGGRWGPNKIALIVHLSEVVVGRYLKAFYQAGIHSIMDGKEMIKIPHNIRTKPPW